MKKTLGTSLTLFKQHNLHTSVYFTQMKIYLHDQFLSNELIRSYANSAQLSKSALGQDKKQINFA